jgi:NAD(P)-dependent dehydrogenase (short-subunit alcohol dehydrogenase family)
MDYTKASPEGMRALLALETHCKSTVDGRLSHYAASKAALEQLTRCWALELAPKGIRVNDVAAGPVETGFLEERMRLTDRASARSSGRRLQTDLPRPGTGC